MKALVCTPGTVMVDSYPYSLQPGNFDVISGAADVFCGYINILDPTGPSAFAAKGISFHPVTTAGEYKDGADDEVRWLKAAGLPKGIHVSLDLEGPATVTRDDPKETIRLVTEWGARIAAEGYIPSLYVGAPQPLTSEELWRLPNFRLYWRGMGSTRDRYGHLAEPTRCGFAITQVYPSTLLGGKLVDYNIIGQDYLRRTLIVAGQ